MMEYLRLNVTELAFALTTFREEINLKVGFMFGLLLYAKTFHLLNELRVEMVEQAEHTPRLAHFRIVSLSFFLMILDLVVVAACSYQISKYGVSVSLLFGFEHLLLFISLLSTIVKYVLTLIEIYRGRWVNKSHYELIVSIINEGLQFVTYISFAAIVFNFYGVPIHLMRGLYFSFKNLLEKVSHYIRYRRYSNNAPQSKTTTNVLTPQHTKTRDALKRAVSRCDQRGNCKHGWRVHYLPRRHEPSSSSGSEQRRATQKVGMRPHLPPFVHSKLAGTPIHMPHVSRAH